MLDKELPLSLNNSLTRMACIVVLFGAIAIRFVEWPVIGWAIVAYGLLALLLAHLVAVAPYWVEPTSIDRADG
jgi:hypothetical protein